MEKIKLIGSDPTWTVFTAAKLMRTNRVLLFLLLFGCSAVSAGAQALVDRDDNQSWNDLQLTVPMNKQFDFYMALTERFGKNISQVNDERLAIGFVYKPHKSWSFMPFYWNISARNSRNRFRTEHRLNLRIGYRFPFKSFGLSHRSTFERRLRRPQNSWRYRASLTFDKDIPKNIIPGAKFFITDEIFYDSLLKEFSRHRFTIGVTKTLTKKLSLDIYYMRQMDGLSRPGDLNVVGTSWKIRL